MIEKLTGEDNYMSIVPLLRFCCVILRDRFLPEQGGHPLLGHTLTLLPALRLENLLPLELQYKVANPERQNQTVGNITPGDTKPFHEVTS